MTPAPISSQAPQVPAAGALQAAASSAPREAARPSDGYGIRRAIELLRRLPPGDRALLVEVVKMALESANVQVTAIVDDASRRGSEIDQRIAVLRREVTEREEEISTRRKEIANLEVEQDEISRVKQQLGAVYEPAGRPNPVKAPSSDKAVAEGGDHGRALAAAHSTPT